MTDDRSGEDENSRACAQQVVAHMNEARSTTTRARSRHGGADRPVVVVVVVVVQHAARAGPTRSDAAKQRGATPRRGVQQIVE